MQIQQTPNFLYDLSNPHFEQTEIITTENQTLKGKFVQFKVVKGEFENLFPAEKYCFLPTESLQVYEQALAENKGEFKEFPKYVLQISMSQLKQITIKPTLVSGMHAL